MNEDHVQAAQLAIPYMKMHLDHDLTSEHMAAHVEYSHYPFTRVFKRVTDISPPSFRGMIFVGLFPHPIPDQRPIKGTAINQNSRGCTFTNVPPGMYYVMAAGIA